MIDLVPAVVGLFYNANLAGGFCSCHSLADVDLSLPQHPDDLFRGVSLSGYGLTSIILITNPNLRLGPVFGDQVSSRIA